MKIRVTVNLLQHVNILRLMGLIVDEHNQNKGLVLEYCSGGPLNTWLKKNQNVLSLKNSIDWALQVALGMEYLHKWVRQFLILSSTMADLKKILIIFAH